VEGDKLRKWRQIETKVRNLSLVKHRWSLAFGRWQNLVLLRPNMARMMSIHSGSTLQRIGQRPKANDQRRLFIFNEIQP
jgi:hypothetical protein